MNEIIDRTLFISVLFGSFLGSWHCAAMCSPFALLAREKKAWTYHLGRGFSYSLLGFLSGYLGEKILFIHSSTIRWLSTGIIIFVITYLFFSYSGFLKTNSFSLNSFIFRKLQVHKKSGFTLGLFSIFLPCGWLWFNLTTAASSLDPIHGALIMVIFWVGTIPALLGVTEIIKKNIIPQQVLQKKVTLWILFLITISSVLLQTWMAEKGIHCKV